MDSGKFLPAALVGFAALPSAAAALIVGAIGPLPAAVIIALCSAAAAVCGRRLAERAERPMSQFKAFLECASGYEECGLDNALRESYNEMIGRLERERRELEDSYKLLERENTKLREDRDSLSGHKNDGRALIDETTGLPNKAAFKLRLSELPDRAEGGVVIVDVDDLRVVKAIMGRAAEISLLREMGGWLSDSRVAGIEFCARGAEGEFLIIASGSRRDMEIYCKSLTERFDRPFALGDATLRVPVNIGVCVFPADDPLADADAALRRSRELGGNTYQFFDDVLKTRGRRRGRILDVLRHSILSDEVFLVYQPEYSLYTGEIVVMEALLRLRNKELGYISPAEFVPVAETNGLMLGLGYWVIEEACNFLNRMPDYTGMVGVNISAIQLFDYGFEERVMEILERKGIAPERLQLEIKETIAGKTSAFKLNKLRKAGIGIALDNFGTAFSSLNQMASLPIDAVKIDRSLINEIFRDDRRETVIKSIIETAHRLGQQAVAEGVESDEQRRFLEQCYCDTVQGYLFSAPLEEEAVKELLAGRRDTG